MACSPRSDNCLLLCVAFSPSCENYVAVSSSCEQCLDNSVCCWNALGMWSKHSLCTYRPNCMLMLSKLKFLSLGGFGTSYCISDACPALSMCMLQLEHSQCFVLGSVAAYVWHRLPAFRGLTTYTFDCSQSSMPFVFLSLHRKINGQPRLFRVCNKHQSLGFTTSTNNSHIMLTKL